MKTTRLLMLGGFLGAGKTTAIARLAKHYVEQGLQVGLVTNDQAYNLVDSHTLRAQGFDVGEVPGACFCCKFDDLLDTVNGLSQESQPDIIITEPVGSCTDLVATVIEPLRQLYAEQFSVGPLAVLLKPEHGLRILRSEQAGFSPQAAYIFLKQIEEAGVVCINKVDKLTDEEVAELRQLLQDRFPQKRILAISGREGNGFDELVSELAKESAATEQYMDIDYDVYAAGEAELGWLNAQASIESSGEEKFELDQFVLDLVQEICDTLGEAKAEPAHLKVLGQTLSDAAVANLVGSGFAPELSLRSEIKTNAADLVVNARVAVAPDRLRDIVQDTVMKVAKTRGLKCVLSAVQCFSPGRPVPTHQMRD